MKTIEQISIILMIILYGIGILITIGILVYVIKCLVKKLFPGNPACVDLEEECRRPDVLD